LLLHLNLMQSPLATAPNLWMGTVRALILIGIVVVPVATQAALGIWWLRRCVRRSGASAPLSLSWFLGQAFGFWLFCTQASVS
jgi:hypothetical protein